mgnify:CR=1 FL=1
MGPQVGPQVDPACKLTLKLALKMALKKRKEHNLDSWVLFLDLAKAFDEELWEFRARCWHSAAVLVHLNQQLGERFQVRLMAESITGARAPYMSPGRWSHSYRADNRGKRMDVIIERPDIADGTDSFSHKARVFRNRPDDPTVALFARAFEEAWKNGTLLDETLTQALLETLDGPEAR